MVRTVQKYASEEERKAARNKSRMDSRHKNKELHAAKQRIYYALNKESINRNKRTPEYRRQQETKRIFKKYGITIEQYDAMLVDQKGLCAICGPHTQKGKRKNSLSIDHDHSSMFIRGLLCDRCNTILGMARDNPIILKAAAFYLDLSQYRQDKLKKAA